MLYGVCSVRRLIFYAPAMPKPANPMAQPSSPSVRTPTEFLPSIDFSSTIPDLETGTRYQELFDKARKMKMRRTGS